MTRPTSSIALRARPAAFPAPSVSAFADFKLPSERRHCAK
jgi:hypothetical protein